MRQISKDRAYHYLWWAFQMALTRYANPRFLAHIPKKYVAMMITLPVSGPLALAGVQLDLNNWVHMAIAIAASTVIVYLATYVIVALWRGR
jgi:hypothetical protein